VVSKDYIELLSNGFERVGIWCYDHRSVVSLLCTLLLATAGYFASQVRFDNSFSTFFAEDDPIYSGYVKFLEDFGSEEISYIVYDAPASPHGVWDLEVMRKIERLTQELESQVPFVAEVTSLTNAEFVEGVPDGLEIHEILEEFPASQEELLAIRDKVLAKPLYENSLASSDGRYAAIILEAARSSLDPVEELRWDPEGGDGMQNLYPQVMYSHIEEILSRPDYGGIRFYHTGDVPINAVYNQLAQDESIRLGSICFLVIGSMLALFFRSWTGVAGPLAVVFLSIVIGIGLVGLLGWPLDLIVIMLPILLIAVGVAHSIHIISEFRAHHAELGDRREAARQTLYLVGTPCLLTSLTTAAGLWSMSISSIKSISHFANYAAVGVIAAFILSITLLMLFLSLGRQQRTRDASQLELDRARGGLYLQRALVAVCRFDVRHRRGILIFSALVFVLSGLGMMRLEVDSNLLSELGDSVPIKSTTALVDEVMGGSLNFIYVFDSGQPDGMKAPEAMREVERFENRANEQRDLVKKSHSVVDLMKDINQSFHAGDPELYVLPNTRELMAQYLLVYEISGGKELQQSVTWDYARAKLEVRIKSVKSSDFESLVSGLDRYLEEEPLSATTVQVTGFGALYLRLATYVTQSQIRGFALAFMVIAALMCFVFRSIKLGMLSMIPNLSPVVLSLGVMGWLGISLDFIRLMLGALAIGIAVDDTIHLVTRYVHEFKRCGDYEQALFASMREVGRALFFTSAVLVAGFLVLLPSALETLVIFGALCALTIFVALVADFFLMPALVLTFKPFGRTQG
jgi:predicted RND superfamily exporter protein